MFYFTFLLKLRVEKKYFPSLFALLMTANKPETGCLVFLSLALFHFCLCLCGKNSFFYMCNIKIVFTVKALMMFFRFDFMILFLYLFLYLYHTHTLTIYQENLIFKRVYYVSYRIKPKKEKWENIYLLTATTLTIQHTALLRLCDV